MAGRKPGSRNKAKAEAKTTVPKPSEPVTEEPIRETAKVYLPVGNAPSVLPTKEELATIEQLLEYIEEGEMMQHPRPVARMLILKGMELGLKPLTALSQLVPKKGQIAFERAEYMRQMISRVGGALIPVESTDQVCRMKAVRKIYGKVVEADYSYDLKDAMAAGLLGHGDFWDTHRRDMLYSRCTTRAGRGMFADVIAGVSYTSEELEPAVWEESAPQPTSEPAPERPAAPLEAAASTKEVESAPPAAQPAESPKTQEFLKIGSRVLDHPISWVGTNGEAMHGFSAGAAYSQLSDINQLCKNDRQSGEYVFTLMDFILFDREKGAPPALRGLTAAEADTVIKVLQEVAPANRPTAKQLFLTWDRAYAEFRRVVLELNYEEFLAEADVLIAAHYQRISLKDMTKEEVLDAADELRRLHRESAENVTKALRLCRQELTGQPVA